MKNRLRFSMRARLTWFAVIGGMVLLLGAGSALATSPTAGWPAAKAQLYQREQQEMAAARAHPRPKPPMHSVIPSHQVDPPRHAGIDDMRQGPFSALEFTVRNFWQGPIGSDWMLVYAGAKRGANGSAGGGALRLYNEPINANGDYTLQEIGTFAAPAGTGALKIIAVKGDTMQLSTGGGKTISFDLRTHRYQ